MAVLTVAESLLNPNQPYVSPAVPNDAPITAVVQLTSSEWDRANRAGITVTMLVERSDDGGQTWDLVGGIPGGVLTGTHGRNNSLPSFQVSSDGAPGRVLRGSVRTSAALRVGFTVTTPD